MANYENKISPEPVIITAERFIFWLTLSLRWQDSFRNLRAMPHPLSWSIKMQHMGSPLGSRNHGSPCPIRCPSCNIGSIDVGTVAPCVTCKTHSQRKRPRDRSSFMEEAPQRKRLRLRQPTDARREIVFTDLSGRRIGSGLRDWKM